MTVPRDREQAGRRVYDEYTRVEYTDDARAGNADVGAGELLDRRRQRSGTDRNRRSAALVTLAGAAPVDLAGAATPAPPALSVDLETWSYDLRGVIGLVEYSPRAWIWPYASFGLGGITYDVAESIGPPLLTFVERGSGAASTPEALVVVERRSREFLPW